MKLAIEKIIVSKDNPRQSFDEEGLRRLGQSIKTYGQLHSVIVRPRGLGYELVVGERRLRACVLVGLTEVNAEVRELDDRSAKQLRLIENIHREDLSDAEKGDAVLELWALDDKYETYKDVADSIVIPEGTVYHWVNQSRRLSPQLKEYTASYTLTNEHAKALLKYPHSVQDKLAKTIIKKGISSHKEVLRRFTKLYDGNPKANLDELADKVLGIETITIPKTELTAEQKKKHDDEKVQLTKVQKVRKKPTKPITKEEVKEKLEKKADFKFVKATVSHGKAGLLPQLKMEVKPTILPNMQTPDYTLCKCALCPLFAVHCKGRCWT